MKSLLIILVALAPLAAFAQTIESKAELRKKTTSELVLLAVGLNEDLSRALAQKLNADTIIVSLNRQVDIFQQKMQDLSEWGIRMQDERNEAIEEAKIQKIRADTEASMRWRYKLLACVFFGMGCGLAVGTFLESIVHLITFVPILGTYIRGLTIAFTSALKVVIGGTVGAVMFGLAMLLF